MDYEGCGVEQDCVRKLTRLGYSVSLTLSLPLTLVLFGHRSQLE
jgi:hypothetical protein